MEFLKAYKKGVEKSGVSTDGTPPTHWFSSGNHVLNRIVSGDYDRALPQGRILALCGFSGAGKSFICGNMLKQAQDEGAFVLVIDSENALDDAYLGGIGVDLSPDRMMYSSPTTIPQAVMVVSAFMRGYKAEYKDKATAPKVVICVDSLDMLMTQSAYDHLMKGDTVGDQGQHAKQIKDMLKSFVQDIKGTNVSMIVTKQVYSGQGMFADPNVVAESMKYSCSTVLIITKLKLKDESNPGIRMKCYVSKTRFALPFQSVVIEVPYSTGMNPYSGLQEVATSLGVIEGTTWITIKGTDIKVNGAKKLEPHMPLILEKCRALGSRFIEVDEDEIVADTSDNKITVKSKKAAKFPQVDLTIGDIDEARFAGDEDQVDDG